MNLIYKRIIEMPEFYESNTLRILRNLNEPYIEDSPLNPSFFSFRDTVNITREFLEQLDPNFLNILNYLLNKDAVDIEYSPDFEGLGGFFTNYKLLCKMSLEELMKIDFIDISKIYVEAYSISNAIYILTHEVGHAVVSAFSNSKYYDESIYDETIPQLFTFLLTDYARKKYPRLDIYNEGEREISATSDISYDLESFAEFVLYDKDNKNNFYSIMEAFDFEKTAMYAYSLALAKELYDHHMVTGSLEKAYKLMYLSNQNNSLTYVLNQLGINKREVGTKNKVKEIRNRYK